MSSVYIASLYYARKQIGLYFGIPVLIVSVVGEFFSVIILLSLKTFRQNSCSLYLITMSVFNLIRLVLSTVFVILSLSFGIDYSVSIFFFCQLRNFIVTTCNLGSVTCLCMAVIDQYFATCSRPRWQRWSNITIAYRITAIITLIWMLNGIPYVIFFDNISPTNTAICITFNRVFLEYHTYGYFVIYNNLLPLITIIFGLMAFQNVRHLAHRTVPLVRRALEKQLTIMVLVQSAVHTFTYLPFSVVTTMSAIYTNRDPVYLAEINLINAIALVFSVYSNGVRAIIDETLL